ncbi:pseudouridine synthase [Clostridium sp. SHJSY1]|uniref:pseudouridine synthase n=1 Tax=Clostridium sp. SHJSY1 TaxID=2942483 RepID=UPI002875DD28|nr:pseudouridine synthase [Clostridium sp. SHJSY1]MDS0526452.1 pseudouridine synthase [Clostridium sp. SHJSY1]
MRINKLLSNYGICSRREANRIIEDGRIIVNGELCIPGQWVEEDDEIFLDNMPIKKRDKVYILLNKPVGVTCTAAEAVENNIIDYINYTEYIFPVGRLDKESQGLILLTNDGELASKILESDNYHEKEYIVTLNKTYDELFLEGMASGVQIGDVKTRPCVLKRVDDFNYSIILTQGLNKQIRKMSKAFGYDVVKLKRIRIINLKIDGLKYGKWRYLSFSEINEIGSLLN